MKCWLLALALPLFAQSSDRELALGSALRQQILRESKLIDQPTATNYLREVIQTFTDGIKVELIEINAADPIPLPGNLLMVPANTLRKAKSETEFRTAISHAVAHITLRHGIKDHIYMAMHVDPSRPNLTPIGLREQQERSEQEANAFAAAKVTPQPDSAAFLTARQSLQP